MHQHHGWTTTVAAALAVILWLSAAAITVAAMRQQPSSPARSSLILADLWLMAGAMTATMCVTVLLAAERHRRTFFEYGYLTALADTKAGTPVSINTRRSTDRGGVPTQRR